MVPELPPKLLESLSGGVCVKLDGVFSGRGNALSLVISVDPVCSGEKTSEAWVMKTWSQSHEHRLPEPPAVIEAMRFTEHHPLLLYRAKTESELYFASTPDDVERTLVELRAAHEEVAADFIPFRTYLNDGRGGPDDLRKLVASGHGLLARGPDRLMQAYATVVMRRGCKVNLLVAPQFSADSRPQPKVLELAPAGVVMADAFVFKRYMNPSRLADLIEKLRGW